MKNLTLANNNSFEQGLRTLGFDNDDCLFIIDSKAELHDFQILFHLETAKEFGATAVYLRKQLNGSYKPQVYLFDKTDIDFHIENEKEISEIQKKIWSSGDAPISCIFYKTEVKIIDCTKHLTKDFKPEYLVNSLSIVNNVNQLYNEQFAVKVKTGIFWEQEEIKNKFKFQNSAYDKLIENIKFVTGRLSIEYRQTSTQIVNKIIIQAILIKYLEERIDSDGNKLLSKKYFKKYDNASTFNDVLRKGKFVELLSDLNDAKTGFNGNVFKWETSEQKQLSKLDLSIVADLLAADRVALNSVQGEIKFPDWRYFEFKFIPVELISRLYEEFLGVEKKDKGLFYTPSHLAKLLVDECLPLRSYATINLAEFRILDPACGSGIFLVVAFKRLVQIWRLQNQMKFPDIKDLKPILKNIYGVDKEEQAVHLASFSLSLALCNELNPLKIINQLKFDDLTENNLINSDFFGCKKIKNKQFDLIIGNPPFRRGAISEYNEFWELENKKIKIPQGQIALKFLCDSLLNLKDGGLICLIIKSSGLLYNSSSTDFKNLLFSNLNVVQILDFTALGRNKSLWDNGADVASAAIFLRKERPDLNKNILHVTFRRTKATKERIVFEIDDYDLHFVSRMSAIKDEFIWKNNLLGGGRIKNVIEKVKYLPTFKAFLEENKCEANEGFIEGTGGKLRPAYLFEMQTLPTEAINENIIDYTKLKALNKKTSFVKVCDEPFFTSPNIIIWENIGLKRLPIFYNEKTFSFKHKLIGIYSKNSDKIFLKSIVKSFDHYADFYRFFIYVTSSQLLINLNTTVLKNDIMQLRFLNKIERFEEIFSIFDTKIISDVNNFMQDFLGHGEKSKALKIIEKSNLVNVLVNYGGEFCRALNVVFKQSEKRFRLSDVIELDSSLIATVFQFDDSSAKVKFHKDFSKLNISGLTNHEISAELSVNRIIKLNPQKDMIVFVKPNQYRYWISLTAYRDADKCFFELSQNAAE